MSRSISFQLEMNLSKRICSFIKLHKPSRIHRSFCSAAVKCKDAERDDQPQNYIDIGSRSNITPQQVFGLGLQLIPDFVTEEEENVLLDEILPLFQSIKYLDIHWDNVIHNYREIEKSNWKEKRNELIITRIRTFIETHEKYKHRQKDHRIVWRPGVHIIDLHEQGDIGKHVDNAKTGGELVVGLSLLSDALMKFRSEKVVHHEFVALLPRRSLYIMSDDIR